MSVVPTILNPPLSAELRTEVEFFQKWGYLVIEDAITNAQIERLRLSLDQSHQRTGTQFIGELLEQDEEFLFLLDNPSVLQRIKAILGNCVQLHSATSRVTEPGESDQNWHRDGPWPVDPDGTPYGSLPGQINCGYYLDEITMENGPIVIVPSSQRALFRPPEGHPTISGRKICDGETRTSHIVRWMDLSPWCGQHFQLQPASLPNVLPKCLDEIKRIL